LPSPSLLSLILIVPYPPETTGRPGAAKWVFSDVAPARRRSFMLDFQAGPRYLGLRAKVGRLQGGKQSPDWCTDGVFRDQRNRLNVNIAPTPVCGAASATAIDARNLIGIRSLRDAPKSPANHRDELKQELIRPDHRHDDEQTRCVETTGIERGILVRGRSYDRIRPFARHAGSPYRACAQDVDHRHLVQSSLSVQTVTLSAHRVGLVSKCPWSMGGNPHPTRS